MSAYSAWRDRFLRVLLGTHPRVRALVLDVLAPVRILLSFIRLPAKSLTVLAKLPTIVRGTVSAERWGEKEATHDVRDVAAYNPQNPLERYFHEHASGPMIFKWSHYFSIYHRHLSKFINREVNVVEIGIYGGGSLSMWKEYFGGRCAIYGVDIQKECKAFEQEGVHVLIGDQA